MTQAAVRRVADEAGVSHTALMQAMEWLVMIWSREATADQLQALSLWRESDPEHERAWQRVQQLNSRLDSIPKPLAGSSLRGAQAAMVGRRKTLGGLAALLASALGGYAARDTTVVQSRLADVRTRTGEIRVLTLDDGTRVTLNTASALDIRFTGRERRIVLAAGEILVRTATDSAAEPRPFIVQTAQGAIEPIGTRFRVFQQDDLSGVAVFEGAVNVRPRKSLHQAIRLDAGQYARISESGVEKTESAEQASVAWAQGRLVVEQMRLGDFLHQVNRYRRGIIRCDGRAAGLLVSGNYPLPDTDRILAALEQALPIRIRTLSRYWVTVEALEP